MLQQCSVAASDGTPKTDLRRECELARTAASGLAIWIREVDDGAVEKFF
jgi:hypothetical protein